MSLVLRLVFAAAAATLAVIAVGSARRRRESPAAGAMLLVTASVSFWSFCELVSVLPVPSNVAVVARSLVFVGIGGVVPGFYFLSLAVVDRGWRLTRRAAVLLSIEPALLLAAVATNPWHHRFVEQWVVVDSSFSHVQERYGPLFWPHMVYSNGILLIGVLRLVRAAGRRRGPARRLYVALLLATIPPMIGNFLSVTKITGTVNLTVIGFTVTACITYVVIDNDWFTHRVPVAHQRILDAVGDAVLVVDRRGIIITTNPSADRLAARLDDGSPTSMCGRPLREVMAGLSLDDSDTDDLTEREQTLLDARGRGIDLHVRVGNLRDHRDRHIGWTLVARDITEIQRQRTALERANAALEQANDRLSAQLQTIEVLREDLAEQAVRDPLTGLFNRRYITAQLDRLAIELPPDEPLSLAIVDIDHFKHVNDRYGHGGGDLVLVQLAHLLRDGKGPRDIVGRHGGEEFVLLMPGSDEQAATSRVDRLRQSIESTIMQVDGPSLSITVSAGVSTVRGPFLQSTLFHAADTGLYAAKDSGRNRVVSTDPVAMRAAQVTATPAPSTRT